MTFFYDLNKKLDEIRATPEIKHGQLNEGAAVAEASTGDYSAKKARAGKDIGKPGKNFEKIAKGAAERYGSKERGEKVAGAVLAKLRKEEVEEGLGDMARKVGGAVKRVAGQALDTMGHGSDEDLIRKMQKDAGLPQTGMKPTGAKPTGHPMDANEGVDKEAFAALAPPTDKITFADKIAGAKKEVDEMLGDVAAEAMKNALGGRQQVADEGNAFTGKLKATPKGGKFKMGNKEFTDTSNLDEVEGKVYRHKGTYGQSYDPSDDEETKANVKKKKDAAGPAKRGRPEQNTKFDFSAFKKPVVAKGTGSGRVHKLSDKEPGKDKVKEGSAEGQAQQIYNELADLRAAAKQAQGGGQFPQGFASRLESVLYAAMTLIKNQQPGNAQVREDELDEKAVSKQQQKFMGMAHAMQKGEKVKGASPELKKVAKTMKKSDVEDFAKTKHKGLPQKAKKEESKEEVEENTVAGSVAPAAGGAPKGKSGMTFGKGVYEGAIAESFRSKLDNVLNEGMSVNMSADQDGKKSLTVTATDDDAVKLSQLLNLAGIGGQSEGYGAVCADCGSADCGCDHIDEELANSADNTVYSGDALQYSGGLNGPKTDQSTLPVLNQDPRRTIGSVAEGVESRLWELYQRYDRK